VGAQLRVYRRRIRSVQSTKKITKAMELIAASRIARAQQRVLSSRPYAEEITRVIRAVTSQSSIDHPLTAERPDITRSGLLVITSDRGLAGAYNANALREADRQIERMRSQGTEPVMFLVGRKGISYYRFRGRVPAASFSGFSEQPDLDSAKAVADALINAFSAESGEGIDDITIVFTEFVSAITQRAQSVRILPLPPAEEEESRPSGQPPPAYDFEPDAEGVLDALLPRYIVSRVFTSLLASAASESAARRRAMKSASDNADDLMKTLTRLANEARQAEITQEISEIVGGANALAAASGG
jgi:F-type H+-transporting ATPase subunit gamma